MNMKKTEFLVSGDCHDVHKKSGKYPSVSAGGVSNNSFQCSQCMLWVHKKCSGITERLLVDPNYVATGVRVTLGPLMAELRLKWMSTAPYLMWRLLSAT